MNRQILVIGDELLARMVAPMEYDAVRVTELADAVEELHAESTFAAVLVDLRGLEGEAVEIVGELQAAVTAPLPVVAILDPTADDSAVETKQMGVAWVDESWLALGEGEAVRIRLERLIQGFEQASALQDFEMRYEQLVQNEKFAAVGLLAAEIAHEINNPTTFVITNLTVMMDYVDTIASFHAALREQIERDGAISRPQVELLEERHEIRFLEEDLESLLDRSLAGLDRIHQIVQDLRFFSGERRPDSGWVDVAGLVRAASNLVRHQARYRTALVVDLPELPRIRTDPSRLSQVLLNLLVNAVQAVPPGAPESNEVRVRGSADGAVLTLSVSDTGEGIAPDKIDHVFDAFFTTKQPGEGTGLGLSISRDIIRALGGTISVETAVGEGTTFFVSLPIDRGADGDE